MQPINITELLNRSRKPQPSYYVVMIDYGRRGREAIVDPEITRRGVIDRLKSGEYGAVEFIHFIEGGLVEDVTGELVDAAEAELRAEAV